MSRYIEEESIIKAIDESGQRYGITTANQCNFKEIVRKTPAADVVPKSEVAREIFEDLENFIPQLKYCGFGYTALVHKIAELKKKHTEGKEWTETDI